MSGFCLEIRAAEIAPDAPALRPVDLGRPDTAQAFAWGSARLACSYRGASRQWWTREQGGRLLWIEGQPDRYPREDEPLEDWLQGGRWGSYHGVEIRPPQAPSSPPQATIFADPLGTRPLFVHRTPECVLVSDKLSTVALHASPKAEIHWPALLEAMALGSVYTPDTTLRGAEELAPGETIEFQGVVERRRKRYALPAAGDFDRQRVHGDPSGTLLSGMKLAVSETWTDSQSALLLSGGLDSRLVLALAGPDRRAITVGLYDSETEVARQLAACCGAEFQVFPYLPSDSLHSVKLSAAIGAAMHDPHFFNHLGMGERWGSRGVTAVTHAFLFDTLMKGCFQLPAGRLSLSLLAQSMPNAARYFVQTAGRGSDMAPDDIIRMLSPRGRAVVHERLSALDGSIDVQTDGGLDTTYESLVLGRISRQIHYGAFLGWSEELDVSSPIFHPALWNWRRHSRAADRFNGKAFIGMLLSLDHDVIKIVDANTGVPPRVPPVLWQDSVRNNRLYQRFVQPLWRKLAGGKGEVSFSSGLGNHLRQPEALEFLTQWAGENAASEWFDAAAIEAYLTKFKAGEDRYLEPLLACVSAARWQHVVRDKSID
jgi:hypothetical protein